MKKLLFIILLMTSGFMFAQAKHEFVTQFPEETCWTIQGKILYAEYVHSEKGTFKKIVSQRFEAPGGVKVWTITYPTVHVRYIVRVKGSTSVITKERI